MFSHLHILRKLIGVFVLLCMLPGCIPADMVKAFFSPVNDENSFNQGNDSEYNVEIESLHVPVKGEQVVIADPETNEKLNVTFDDVYTSASGTLCSRFTINGTDDRKTRTGLACMDKQRKWQSRILDLQLLNKHAE